MLIGYWTGLIDELRDRFPALSRGIIAEILKCGVRGTSLEVLEKADTLAAIDKAENN